MGQSFFNTVYLSGEDLDRAIASANSQKEKIITYFTNNPKAELTAYEITKALGMKEKQINGVRRALNVLKNESPPRMRMMDKLKAGGEGLPNHLWRLPVWTDGPEDKFLNNLRKDGERLATSERNYFTQNSLFP